MARRPVDPDDPLVQMNVRVPRSVRDAIDARRAVKQMSRDVWVTNGLRYALRNVGPARPMTTDGSRTAPPPRHRHE